MISGVLEAEYNIIKTILEKYTKDYTFYFYGSRVKGTHNKTSDLDVLIKGQTEMPLRILVQLKEKFDNSRLPYIVNFVDFKTLDENFYKKIEKDLVLIDCV